jgi:hypothetical protein
MRERVADGIEVRRCFFLHMMLSIVAEKRLGLQ